MSPTVPVPRSVLVVDDDGQISQVICAALRLCGAKPICVETFGAALVEIRHRNCETVLLDLTLPDSSPEQTLKSIPFLIDRGAGQIIVITGSEVTGYLRGVAIQNGAKEVLSKDDGDLFTKIMTLVKALPSFSG